MAERQSSGFALTTRRCAFERRRYRWTIAVPDGYRYEHSTISYPTEAEAHRAGTERVRQLRLAAETAGPGAACLAL